MFKFRSLAKFVISWFKLNVDFIQHKINRMKARPPTVKGLPKPKQVLERPCVFVLSTGRCGTELLTRLLMLSPELQVEHSPKPELEYTASLVHKENPTVESLKYAVLAARFDVYFLDAYFNDKIYVETNNRITLFAPGLSSLLKNSIFIHLVRNPADFVRSGMRRKYYADGFVQHQRLMNLEEEKYKNLSRLEKISIEWNEINRAIEDFKNSISPNRILTVRSEDLFYDCASIDRILKFFRSNGISISRPTQKSIDYLFKKPVNAQKTGNYPKFSEWSEDDKNHLRVHTPLSVVYGYDNN